MKPLYGPAIVFPHGCGKTEADSIGSIALRMITFRVTEFNIVALPGATMVVFRHDQDALRVSYKTGFAVANGDTRYYHHTIIV